MKQAILTDNGFEMRDVPEPCCGAGEVVVRILANGICAGDLGRYRDTVERLGRELLLGHEACGEITAVGAGVAAFRPGDLVAGLGGFFAEYHAFPSAHVVKLPENVNPLWALGEPVACCMHAMRRARIKKGDRVAILGCGFMGLVCLQLARYFGASAVTAIDVLPERLVFAERFGAERVMDASSINPERLRSDGMDFDGEYDVVVEAVGNQAALEMSGFLVRQHGLLLIVGHHCSDQGMRTIYMNQWNVKAIDVVNGHVRRNDEKRDALSRGMALAATGELILEPLVTYYPLFRIDAAFEECAKARSGVIKGVIVMEDSRAS